MLFGIWWQHAAFWVFCLLAGRSLDSELPPLENLITRALQFHLERWQNELISLSVQTWCLKCLVSSWTPQSPHSLWMSSWIYWDLRFPELPCVELLLGTPGRVTHFTESCPKCVGCSTELSGLDSSKANGGPVAHQTLLLLFVFCIVQGLLFLEKFGFFFSGHSKAFLRCLFLF